MSTTTRRRMRRAGEATRSAREEATSGGDKEPDRTDEGTLRRARLEGRKRGGS